MGTLELASIELPTAQLRSVSPLPMLGRIEPIAHIADDVPADIAERASAGYPPSLLPYQAQDDYDRQLSARPHRVAVLENESLTATVAPDLGGRLLSLVDRRTGRQLLYVNPVVQPANLALRNGWFSGGVEWNIGTRGHSPLTMETLHTARVEGPDGNPILRLWELERLRGVVFQIDLWLPSEASAFLASIRIRNLNDIPTPMYWWTNAAVSVHETTRVLVPASRAFRTEYPNGVAVARIPDDGDGDVSFPSRHQHAADFFFDIGQAQRPWIACVDGDGSGVTHVSTSRLRGRKLFVWGTGRGGQRWQEWLSHDGAEAYAEIQAGLASTQFEHVMMPGRAEWRWTEAFAPVDVEPEQSHADSWDAAVGHVESCVDRVVPVARLEEWHRASGEVADRPPGATLATGSGWGALERVRRSIAGETWFEDAGTPFLDDSLGVEQESWLALLRTGTFPPHAPDRAPSSYVVGADWEARLASAPQHWLTEYHRAVMRHGRGDLPGAVAVYESSLRRTSSAWGERGLAVALAADGRLQEAAQHAVAATRLAPDEWRLAAAAVSFLLDAERPEDALALLDDLPPTIRKRGRLRLLEGWAAHGAGDSGRAEAVLQSGVEVADLREGERSIDALWNVVFPDRPVPPQYDFRMTQNPSRELFGSCDDVGGAIRANDTEDPQIGGGRVSSQGGE